MQPILKDAHKFYVNTKKNPEYELSHIWRDGSYNQMNLLDIIINAQTPEQVISMLEKTDMYAITISNQRLFDLMMQWHKKNVHHCFNIKPDLCSTPNLYKMIQYCEDIYEHCSKINAIVELGGGNGQFAFMAKHTLGNSVHVDIDIPESLWMAYVCTRHRFPEAKTLWVESNDKINIAGYDFVFVPTIYASAILGNEFDLFINTASMGELPNKTIRFWMDFVQNQLKVKYFFGFNRFLNTVKRNDLDNSGSFSCARLNENEASVLFDKNWDILKWEIEPLFSRCPYEDTRIARYLEIIACRNDNPEAVSGTLDNVIEQDWWRLRQHDATGTARSNQLVHDYTMDGTLFKLWNHLRVSPSKEIVNMMLTYMLWIGRETTAFEEEYYYKRLYEVV